MFSQKHFNRIFDGLNICIVYQSQRCSARYKRQNRFNFGYYRYGYIMRYLIELRDQIYVKGYKFLSFVKKTGQTIDQ